MASVTLTITGIGNKIQISEEVVDDGSSKISLSKLLNGVKKLQQEANTALTTMVNEEKGKNSTTKNKPKTDDSEGDLEDNEEDDDDADDSEPLEKKPKP